VQRTMERASSTHVIFLDACRNNPLARNLSRSMGTRSADIGRGLAAVESGVRPLADHERLDEETRAFEAVALGLRTVEGFSRHAFAAEFGADPLDRYSEAVAESTRAGLLEVDGDAVRLSPAGRLLASEALVAFAPLAHVG